MESATTRGAESFLISPPKILALPAPQLVNTDPVLVSNSFFNSMTNKWTRKGNKKILEKIKFLFAFCTYQNRCSIENLKPLRFVDQSCSFCSNMQDLL